MSISNFCLYKAFPEITALFVQITHHAELSFPFKLNTSFTYTENIRKGM